MTRSIVLVMAFLTALTLHLLLFSYSAMIPHIIEEMKISHAEAGLIFSACIIAIIVLRIPWGLLSDRLGFTATMKLAMTLVAIFSLLRGVSTDYYTLMACQLLLGIGFAAILPCLAKIVNVMFREKAGSATGIYVSGFPTGEILGLSLTSQLLLALHGDWRFVFLMLGVWSTILAALWLAMPKESLGKQTYPNSQLVVSLRRLIRTRDVWMLIGLCICSMGCYDTLLTWLLHMIALSGMSSIEASAIASAFPLGFLAAGLVVGTLSDKVGLRRPFIWTLGLAGGGLIMLIPYATWLSLLGTVLLSGFALSGILTMVLVIPTEHPEMSGFAGGVVGLVFSLGNIGTFLFPIVVGFLIDITGSPMPPLIVLAIVCAATAVPGLGISETGRAGLSATPPAHPPVEQVS